MSFAPKRIVNVDTLSSYDPHPQCPVNGQVFINGSIPTSPNTISNVSGVRARVCVCVCERERERERVRVSFPSLSTPSHLTVWRPPPNGWWRTGKPCILPYSELRCSAVWHQEDPAGEDSGRWNCTGQQAGIHAFRVCGSTGLV